jgi:hypothetical protein
LMSRPQPRPIERRGPKSSTPWKCRVLSSDRVPCVRGAVCTSWCASMPAIYQKCDIGRPAPGAPEFRHIPEALCFRAFSRGGDWVRKPGILSSEVRP